MDLNPETFLETFNDGLPLLTLNQLHKLKSTLHKRMNTYPAGHISQYVHVQPGFISIEMSATLQQNLWDRLKASNSRPRTKSNVRYLWITKSNRSYKFAGHEALEPTPFLDNDPLLIVLDLTNKTLPPHQWLDSCLVAFYENGEIGVGFHDDSEKDINQACPMININLSEGLSTRDIVFRAKENSPYSGSETFTLPDCCMLTMEPGCQQGFDHKVPPQTLSKGRRILCSFRKATAEAISQLPQNFPAKPITSRRKSLPAVPDKPFVHQDPPPRNAPPPCAQPDPSPLSTLILGTSITRPINLANSLNLSKGGETIPDLIQNIRQYHDAGKKVPKCIIVHGGTKDLLKARRAQDLKPALNELLQTIKELYPTAHVMFMSLLPIDACRQWPKSPKKNKFVTTNVLAFNRLARYLCKVHKVYHIHALNEFLMPDGDSLDRNLFKDYVHPSPQGTKLLQRILAEHLLKPFPKALIPRTKPDLPTKRTPMNMMASPILPQTLPIDDTPPNLSPDADVSSEVEITATPIATSSPPPSPTNSDEPRSLLTPPSQTSSKNLPSSAAPPHSSKSLIESALDKIKLSISSIVAPDEPT